MMVSEEKTCPAQNGITGLSLSPPGCGYCSDTTGLSNRSIDRYIAVAQYTRFFSYGLIATVTSSEVIWPRTVRQKGVPNDSTRAHNRIPHHPNPK
jgi:hypothetical protein